MKWSLFGKQAERVDFVRQTHWGVGMLCIINEAGARLYSIGCFQYVTVGA